MHKYLLLFALSVITLLTSAQNNDTQKIQQALQILGDRGEVVLKFTVYSKSQINNDLTKIMSIDHVVPLPGGSGYEVTAYANSAEFQKFLTRNIPYEIVPKAHDKALTMATTVAEMANWDRYPIYSVYEQMMANFAANYPDLCDIDTILSVTPSGDFKILVAKISDNLHTDENEPQFFYSSSMHGDETTGIIMMLRLIDYLLTNYGSNQQVTNLVNGIEIWICPMANPDGTYRDADPPGSTVEYATRYNLAGLDLNRNYPDPRVGPNPDTYAYQAETQGFMTFADKHHFNMGANFHCGAEVFDYPWDTWLTSENPNADVAWWLKVGSDYVATVRTVYSSYMTYPYASGVVEGGDWYIDAGNLQDYMNFFKHCRESTIELDVTHTTETQNLNLKWNENYASLLNYMQESMYGVRGIITDSCSGQPVRAKVWVNSYDQANDSSQVYSGLPIGNYHKYMIAGTYSITYSAPGYKSKTVNNVVLANGSATYVNVTLAPTGLPDAQFTSTPENICSGTVWFKNTSTASNTYLWSFGDGTASTQENPTHTYTANGTYTVKLYATNCKGTDSLVRTNYVTINVAFPPNVTNGATCGAGAVALAASGSGLMKWYNAASGGTLISTGPTYTTPVLTTTTTYYVENNGNGPAVAGGKTFVLSGGSGTSANEHYLIFDSYIPFNLISVKVYNTYTSSISRTISLKNSLGAALQSATVSLAPGLNTVTLNFAVPEGSNLRLSCSNGTYLYRNNSGVNYNYTTPGILSITSCDAGYSYYYYFYDWQVQTTGCVSSRVPAVARVNSIPTAGFSFAVASNSVTFTNSSTGAASYNWDFGDGATSTLQNPGHTYPATGTYNVRLIAANNGCSDTVYHNVTISGTGYTISGKTRYTGKALAGSPAPNNPAYNQSIYNISSVIVILKNYPSGNELARDTSDATGYYQFTNIANGNYIMSYDKYTADTMQWGNDINAIDLSQIKYLITTDTMIDPSLNFSAKYKKAANVDNNTSVNAIDVSRIKAKIGSPATAAKNFPKGNWVALDTLVTVAGSDLNINLKTICYGDYNASSSRYRDSLTTWGQEKSDPQDILFQSEDYLAVSDADDYFEIPLRVNSKIDDFSALGLELKYPENNFKLVYAFMPGTACENNAVKINPSLDEIISDNNDLLVTEEDGIIRVVYATTAYRDVSADDELIRLGFRSLKSLKSGELDFELSGTGVIGNKYGQEKENFYLMMPKMIVEKNNSTVDSDFNAYPNPFTDKVILNYNLPESANVRLCVFNTPGEMVAELLNENQEKGEHHVIFHPGTLPQGIYTFRLEYTGSQKSNCLFLKMINR